MFKVKYLLLFIPLLVVNNLFASFDFILKTSSTKKCTAYSSAPAALWVYSATTYIDDHFGVSKDPDMVYVTADGYIVGLTATGIVVDSCDSSYKPEYNPVEINQHILNAVDGSFLYTYDGANIRKYLTLTTISDTSIILYDVVNISSLYRDDTKFTSSANEEDSLTVFFAGQYTIDCVVVKGTIAYTKWTQNFSNVSCDGEGGDADIMAITADLFNNLYVTVAFADGESVFKVSSTGEIAACHNPYFLLISARGMAYNPVANCCYVGRYYYDYINHEDVASVYAVNSSCQILATKKLSAMSAFGSIIVSAYSNNVYITGYTGSLTYIYKVNSMLGGSVAVLAGIGLTPKAFGDPSGNIYYRTTENVKKYSQAGAEGFTGIEKTVLKTGAVIEF